MHELSIAMSIIDLAEEEARKANASVITKVEVEIGTMVGVEKDALIFSWDSVIQGTMAKEAPLEIHSIQAEAKCLECGQTFPAEHYFVQCPNCQSYSYNITRGKELRVSSLLVD